MTRRDNPAGTTVVQNSVILGPAEGPGGGISAATRVVRLAPVPTLSTWGLGASPGTVRRVAAAHLVPPSPVRILILDDTAVDAELAVAALEEAGCTCDWERVDCRETFLKRLSESTYDLILADYSLPAINGMTALRLLCEHQVDIPFIIVSGALGEERAIDAVKAGATDYVLKTHLARLGAVVQRALQEKAEQRERKHAEEEIRGLNKSLREEAEVEGAVALVGEELIKGLDRPELVDRLCRVTTAVLGCDVSWTVLLNRERTFFAPIAADGATPEQQEAVRVLRFPADTMAPWLAALGRNEVLQVTTVEGARPVDPVALCFGSAATLSVPLRRGQEIIGVLTAGCRGQGKSFTPTHQRIARRVGHLASMALEAARRIENLERANRLKSDFVATMSHELRTPMNIIMGYNDLLRDNAYGPLNREQRRVFVAMDRSARQLLDVITATLDLSRLEGGRLPCSITELDPRELLAEIREESRHLDSPDVRVVWKVSHTLTRLRTDALKVKVILNNLLHNAVKFTEAGQVTVEARSRRGGLALSVTDTGIGIPKDALSFIFEPLRQAAPASTRRHDGVGLGLYLVRRLVDLLEGSITVESEVGRGSIFRVWLPDIKDHRDTEE